MGGPDAADDLSLLADIAPGSAAVIEQPEP
jgi:hypothetical protein